jgi:ethanolamine permease
VSRLDPRPTSDTPTTFRRQLWRRQFTHPTAPCSAHELKSASATGFDVSHAGEMPKRPVRPIPAGITPSAASDARPLGTWQAGGLVLAVIASALFFGLGALLGAVVTLPVIYALARLRAYAPQARSTAELIGSTLGPKAATAAGIVQLVAYLVLASKFSATLGLPLLQLLSPHDPAAVGNWLPLVAVVPAVAATAVAYLVRSRALATSVAVLAAVGVLIYAYLAIALVARVVAGTEPIVIGTAMTEVPLPGQLIGFALAMVGVEVVTVAGTRAPTAGRAMGWAVAMTAAAAALLWYGDHQAVVGPWRWSAKFFQDAVEQFYAESGQMWMLIGSVAIAVAALLTVVWAMVRVAGGLVSMQRRVAKPWLTAVAVPLLIAMTILVQVLSGEWTATVIQGAGVLLIVVLWVLSSEAAARIPGDSVIRWWIRLAIPSLAVIVGFAPLLARSSDPTVSVVTLAVTAAVVAVAWVAALAAQPPPAD